LRKGRTIKRRKAKDFKPAKCGWCKGGEGGGALRPSAGDLNHQKQRVEGSIENPKNTQRSDQGKKGAFGEESAPRDTSGKGETKTGGKVGRPERVKVFASVCSQQRSGRGTRETDGGCVVEPETRRFSPGEGKGWFEGTVDGVGIGEEGPGKNPILEKVSEDKKKR